MKYSQNTDADFPPFHIVKRFLRRVRQGSGIRLLEVDGKISVVGSYELMKNIIPKLKSRGFRYDSSTRQWWVNASTLTLKQRTNLELLVSPYLNVETVQEKKEKEIRRRVQEGLLLQVPFEYKDLARDLGGIWIAEQKMWAFPDQNVVDKVRETLSPWVSSKEQRRKEVQL